MLGSICALAHALGAEKSQDAVVPLELDELLAFDEPPDPLPPLPTVPPVPEVPLEDDPVALEPPPDVADAELEVRPPPPRNTSLPLSPSAHALAWSIANPIPRTLANRMQGLTSATLVERLRAATSIP
jgi:hypothetical protein